MKNNRLISIVLILSIIVLVYPGQVWANSTKPLINKANLEKGIISVDYEPTSQANYIIRINKGMKTYDYPVVPDGKYPLQIGKGDYKVVIGEQVAGKKYKAILSEDIKLDLKEPNAVFLQASYMINWHDRTKAIVKAKELVKPAKSDREKVGSIYNYIVNNIYYDYELAKRVQSGYIPDLDVTFDRASGICYDYATMMAAMLRSVGIPTKLIMGFHKDDLETYHAWNEVYLDGKWIVIDTTYDAVKVQAGIATPMIQNPIDYIAAYKEY